MELTSLIAKDLEKLITRTKCDPQKTLSKLEFYKERKRITVEEFGHIPTYEEIENYKNNLGDIK